jgi:hypothetical protein
MYHCDELVTLYCTTVYIDFENAILLFFETEQRFRVKISETYKSLPNVTQSYVSRPVIDLQLKSGDSSLAKSP